MNVRLGFLVLATLLLLPCLLTAEEEPTTAEVPKPELPFFLPTPEGWRTETIPMPLSFAPEIELAGLEELRFSPGMFKEGAEDFWTYAFIWWVPEDSKIQEEMLETSLTAYFEGLAKAVGEAKGIDFEGVEFRSKVRRMGADADRPPRFSAEMQAFDAFTTLRPISLYSRIELLQCPSHKKMAAFFAVSPQAPGHRVWLRLEEIRSGFLCRRPEPS
ncbi:MAG: hypothetical protein K0U98_27375 [Deltaproteobacteria bacterium]|nr:hypothetical protein [Deltaproteobacteria bacterium]